MARDTRRHVGLSLLATLLLTLGCGRTQSQPSDSVVASVTPASGSGTASAPSDSGATTGLTGRESTLVLLDAGGKPLATFSGR